MNVGKIRVAQTNINSFNHSKQNFKLKRYRCKLPVNTVQEAAQFLEKVFSASINLPVSFPFFDAHIDKISGFYTNGINSILNQLKVKKEQEQTSEVALKTWGFTLYKSLFQDLMSMNDTTDFPLFEIEVIHSTTAEDSLKGFNILKNPFQSKNLEVTLSSTALKSANFFHNGGRILLPIPVKKIDLGSLANKSELAYLYPQNRSSNAASFNDLSPIGLVFGETIQGWKLLTIGLMNQHYGENQLYFSKNSFVEEWIQETGIIHLEEFSKTLPNPMLSLSKMHSFELNSVRAARLGVPTSTSSGSNSSNSNSSSNNNDDSVYENDFDSGFNANNEAPKGGKGPNPEFGDTVGKYCGREYFKDSCGGEILDLDWKDATITKEGIELVKLHTARFGEDESNQGMIERLEQIEQGELEVTDFDLRYYTHEIRELERYRNIGVGDDEEGTWEQWNDAHSATLEDYKIDEKEEPLYHPDTLPEGY